MSQEMTVINTVPFDPLAYKAYGDLIAACDTFSYRLANMGSAKRFNNLCDLENLRPDTAKLNLCVFRCSAWTQAELKIKLLEKHQYSTQVFLPMAESSRYLAIVCLGEETPDLSTLKAFIVEGPQGISYKPGVWHYPMTALEQAIDFSCLVFEDGNKDDCQIYPLTPAVTIQL